MMLPPQRIHNARQSLQLVISWPGGVEQVLSYRELRAACRCASCRAHAVQGRIALIDEDIRILKVINMGQGLQLVFSDGHERGIFPWQYLYELGTKPLAFTG